MRQHRGTRVESLPFDRAIPIDSTGETNAGSPTLGRLPSVRIPADLIEFQCADQDAVPGEVLPANAALARHLSEYVALRNLVEPALRDVSPYLSKVRAFSLPA